MLSLKYFLSVAFMVATTVTAFSQPNAHAVSWIRYQNQLHFNNKFSWINDIDNRRFINPNTQNQFICHSRFLYQTGRFAFGGGLTLSWLYSTNFEQKIKHPTTEVRPVIEVGYEIPYKYWSLKHRILLDNRFIEQDRLDPFFHDHDYTLRFRYRIQARIPIRKDNGNLSRFAARLSDEIMLNHRENLFDQNRIYLMGEFAVNEKWMLETGYIHIYQQRFAQPGMLTRHVLRISVIHKLFPSL